MVFWATAKNILEYTILGFSLLNLFYYFLVYALAGWFIETIYASLQKGTFVNRGFLNGPFCPIYGFGALLFILVAQTVGGNILFLFLAATILASALEYFTGWALEEAFHIKWWDYSDEPFNLKGRICLRFSIYWGIISLVMVKLLQPQVVVLIDHIPAQVGPFNFILFSFYFLGDLLHTWWSLVNLNDLLTQMHKIKLELLEKMVLLKQFSADEIEAMRDELNGKYDRLMLKLAFQHGRLLSAFPRLKSRHHNQVLEDIRSRINHVHR